MKSIIVLSAIVVLAGAANAQTSTGGFTGNTSPALGGFTGALTVSTVAHAKTLKDDTKVTLQGTIERHTGGETYAFSDASGTVDVKIDDDRWAGQSVSPQDRVEIFGEVEKKWRSVKIDVKRLRKL